MGRVSRRQGSEEATLNLGKLGVDCARTGEARKKDNARSCAQRADGMDTEATQRAKKGGKERKRKTAPKEGRGTGEEEEEVEVEGEPEKDTLSQFDGTVLPGNSPSQQRIGNFTGGLSATPWKGFER